MTTALHPLDLARSSTPKQLGGNGVRKMKFTDAEDEQLCELHRVHGPKWVRIRDAWVPDEHGVWRDGPSLRNRWGDVLKHRCTGEGTRSAGRSFDPEQLRQLVAENSGPRGVSWGSAPFKAAYPGVLAIDLRNAWFSLERRDRRTMSALGRAGGKRKRASAGDAAATAAAAAEATGGGAFAAATNEPDFDMHIGLDDVPSTPARSQTATAASHAAALMDLDAPLTLSGLGASPMLFSSLEHNLLGQDLDNSEDLDNSAALEVSAPPGHVRGGDVLHLSALGEFDEESVCFRDGRNPMIRRRGLAPGEGEQLSWHGPEKVQMMLEESGSLEEMCRLRRQLLYLQHHSLVRKDTQLQVATAIKWVGLYCDPSRGLACGMSQNELFLRMLYNAQLCIEEIITRDDGTISELTPTEQEEVDFFVGEGVPQMRAVAKQMGVIKECDDGTFVPTEPLPGVSGAAFSYSTLVIGLAKGIIEPSLMHVDCR